MYLDARCAFYHFRIACVAALRSFGNRRFWRGDRRILALEDRYAGETCVIVGNGPSLNHTNTALLKDRYTFGANRIYLGTKELGFEPTFFVCVNDLVIEQCWNEIKKLPWLKFLSSRISLPDAADADVIWLRSSGQRGASVSFSCNPVLGIWEGHTVTYVSIQLAYWLGFKKVLLVGVDHNFASKGPANEAVVTETTDPNHFRPDYFGKGFKWQLPDLDASEVAYRMADFVYQRSGREIVDCTVDGKCPVFRKSTLESELGIKKNTF